MAPLVKLSIGAQNNRQYSPAQSKMQAFTGPLQTGTFLQSLILESRCLEMRYLVRDLKRRVKDPKAQVTNEFRFFTFDVRQNEAQCSFIAKSEPVNVTCKVTCNAVSLWFRHAGKKLISSVIGCYTDLKKCHGEAELEKKSTTWEIILCPFL